MKHLLWLEWRNPVSIIGVVVITFSITFASSTSCSNEVSTENPLSVTIEPHQTATPSPSPTPTPAPTPTFSEHKSGADEITYKLVVFRARILQALEYEGSFQILANVANPGTASLAGTVSLLYFDAPVRVLEGDEVEFVAEVVGLYTYESVGAGPITVPQMLVTQLRLLE